MANTVVLECGCLGADPRATRTMPSGSTSLSWHEGSVVCLCSGTLVSHTEVWKADPCYKWLNLRKVAMKEARHRATCHVSTTMNCLEWVLPERQEADCGFQDLWGMGPGSNCLMRSGFVLGLVKVFRNKTEVAMRHGECTTCASSAYFYFL